MKTLNIYFIAGINCMCALYSNLVELYLHFHFFDILGRQNYKNFESTNAPEEAILSLELYH